MQVLISQLYILSNIIVIVQMTVYARGVSVLMPGEEIPTFIAHPAPPPPCPPERMSMPLHQHHATQCFNLSSSTSSSTQNQAWWSMSQEPKKNHAIFPCSFILLFFFFFPFSFLLLGRRIQMILCWYEQNLPAFM